MEITWLLGILAVLYCQVAGQRYGGRFGRRSLEFLTAEERLLKNITKRNPYLRPVEKSNETINVNVFMTLISILSVDEKKGFATVEAFERMQWQAPNLIWEPSDFDGIDTMNLPIDRIWHPDLSLLTGGLDAMKLGSPRARVNNTGWVKWSPLAIIKTTCRCNMWNFPFDTCECVARFASWSYDGNEISLDGTNKFVGLFMPHVAWDLYNNTFVQEVHHYSDTYYLIEMTLYLKRRSTYFNYVYISPMVLIALMSPFMFLLPYQQMQRFSSGGCLLICLIVLLVDLDFVFPAKATGLPLICMYYMSIICLLLGAMIISAVILNMAEKISDPPQILKMLIGNGLGSILLLKRTESKTNLVEEVDEDEIKAKKQDGITWKYIATVLDRFFFFVYIVLTIILSIAFTVPR